MLITICDVPSHFADDVETVGGLIVRKWNELIDVQFSNHKMVVRGGYIKIRDRAHHSLTLCDNEFSNIYVQ